MSPTAPAEERLGNDPRSELWGEHRARYRFAIGQGVGGRRVLDVACGAGFGVQMLLQAGACAVGMDLDSAALAESRRLLPRALLARADATRLPLPDASVDLVVSCETLEHVPDPEGLVADFARVLVPAGRLVLSTPNLSFGPPSLHEGNPFHLKEFTPAELRDLLLRHFGQVTLYGQRVDAHYEFVPFLMVERDLRPRAVLFKLQNRLPHVLKENIARAVGGRPFYPGERDYRFEAEATDGAHTLVAVAARPRT